MRTTLAAGIIFANTCDELLENLTEKRSMASVPFGARYRLIDFTLSNYVNAGIANVGIITKGNYRSLMDHLGSGVFWDLDRKNGGLRILPPYNTTSARRYNGTVEALNGSIDFIDRCKADYIVIGTSDVVANVDLEAAIGAHAESDADVTIVYHHGKSPEKHPETMVLKLDGNDVADIKFSAAGVEDCNYGIGITIIPRELLINLVKDATVNEYESFNRDVLSKRVHSLKIKAYKHDGFVETMDSLRTYYKANMQLLSGDVRYDLFNKSRSIYTKTRDDMPTRFGTKSDVNNSLIADGCVIDGTIKNSILFRGVTVEKSAVVENSIIMQGSVIEEGAKLNYVISDKNAVIGSMMVISGTKEKTFFIEKNKTI